MQIVEDQECLNLFLNNHVSSLLMLTFSMFWARASSGLVVGVEHPKRMSSSSAEPRKRIVYQDI